MAPAEVRALLTEPLTYEDWMGGNLNDALCFHGLRLHFDRFDSHGPLPDSSLVELCICGRDDAVLFDQPLFGWSKTLIGDHLQQIGLSPQFPDNGDIDVAEPYMGMSFGADDRLVWFETNGLA